MLFSMTKTNAESVFVLGGQLYAMEKPMSLAYLPTQEHSGNFQNYGRTFRKSVGVSALPKCAANYPLTFVGRKNLLILASIEPDIGCYSAECASFVTASPSGR